MSIACINTNLGQSKRHKPQGETPTEVCAKITRFYQSTHEGESFVSALKANNYSLFKSTRKVIFIFDPKGGEHNLIKRIDAPLKEIESKLAAAQIIDPENLHAEGRVVFGATVDLEDEATGKAVTYQIVGDDEADLKLGLISISSPIARAMIGRSAGDVADVQAPGGVKHYEIVQVRYV